MLNLSVFLGLFALLCAFGLYRSPRLRFLKSVGLVVSLLVCVASITFAGFMRAHADAPLAKVVIPGEHSESGHLVKILSLEGGPIAEHFIQGDLVGIRARIVRTKPFFAFLGLETLCRIELLHSGYMKADATEKLPHTAFEIAFNHSRYLPRILENFWENLFFEHASCFWVKSAALESTYFPLVNKKSQPYRGSFLLTLTSSGLSSLAYSE